MALSHLLKYVYNTGTDEVVRRGKKIHSIGFIEMTDHDDLMNSIAFRVRDDNYNTFYKVNINRYADPGAMNIRCTCPYNLGELCRHEVAALFRLQDMIDKNMLHSNAISYDQRHTVAKMKNIDLKMLRMLSSADIFSEAENLLRHTKAVITSAENDKVVAELSYGGNSYPLVLQKNDERNFDTSCYCNENTVPLCEHKVLLFLQLLHNYGPDYFESIRNWDKDKEKLLRIYGYSLADDLKGKFEFVYKEGKPFLKVLDSSIKRIDPATNPAPREKPSVPEETAEVLERKTPETSDKNYRLAVVLNFNAKTYPYFSVDLAKADDVDEKLINGSFEKLDLGKFVDTDPFSESDKQIFQLVRKLQDTELNKYLNRSSPFGGFWDNIVQTDGEELSEETRSLIVEYIYPKLQRLFDAMGSDPLLYILPNGEAFKKKSIVPVELATEPLKPTFYVSADGDNLVVESFLKTDAGNLSMEDNELNNSLVFLKKGTLYLWNNAEDARRVEEMLSNLNADTEGGWQKKVQETILPLSKKYKVEFAPQMITRIANEEPKVSLQLQERGSYLVFQPVFYYKDRPLYPGNEEEVTLVEDNKILVIKRNKDFEQSIIDKVSALHSQFIFKEDVHALVLNGNDVLRNNWFFLFVDAMKEMNIAIFGFEHLRNFRFNTAKPTTHIHLSSGVDWFDAKVEINFEGQKVGIDDIKRALQNKQGYVPLSDGTLGILPEEWLKKYALLFKVGQGQNNKLRLSKYHMGVIDELYESRDEEEISFQLDEKYQRLREFKEVPQTQPPETLAPILRPYQIAGFQWLNYLNDVGWGGILADDMGLGKTVQSLSMMLSYKTNNGSLLALVVCPTTLIYNWRNELQKFTPELTSIIHHGNLRTRDAEVMSKFNVIITTYGTLRSDIELFTKMDFDYIVLDESQAIKNPNSKVTKAASLLKGKNRVCMSGTPLQNNTFDIYAQMNFLNPGLLGSVDFFRNEFATPIDKFGEKEQKEHLRKLLYPFILRRTKEQVADDLPEKTETVLYCEMGDEQRKIYNAYRNTYRDRILGAIDEQGIERSQLTILQGLMKLRQICDSPAILNEEEKFPNHSVKLHELDRELVENIGNHKALVFSQFLGMLGLIREKLTHLGIPFEYFDGSTPPPEREKAINNFQNNDDCRVFLISLKAGGVGLNLTAADYVYIVDPWWNPAVEQQAIDRTHRIGQTKNIFAYRMICVDTIEDKILQLQERKRALAKELIGDDGQFVKQLTRSDIEYLFS